jgi:hypothetical protein
MWYVLYNITRAGSKFERIAKKVGDISPHNVLINDNGQIKVISTCSIPNELSNFQKVVEDITARVYLGTSVSTQLPNNSITMPLTKENTHPTSTHAELKFSASD